MTRGAASRRERDDTLRLDRQVCFPLYAATNLLNRRYLPHLAAIGLTYPQYLVMLVLWEHDELSMGMIGGLLYLDSGTLTPLLKRMEASTLLTRRRDPKDERRVLVRLTKQGRALRTKAAHMPGLMCAGLHMTQLARVRKLVTELTTTLAGIEAA